MKKITEILAVMLLMMGLVTAPVSAKVISQETGAIVIGEDEVIVDDLYLGAESVEIAGTVEGDVYVGGGMVTMSGVVTGDLVIGGGNVRVSGEIGDDLWIGAGDVSLMGANVGDGVTIGAGSVSIDDTSSIGGSLLVGSGMLDNRAPVGRNLMAGAGMLKLNAPVGGEVRVGAEELILGSKTAIAGDLTYMTEKDLTLAEGATIAGETIQAESPRAMEGKNWDKDREEVKGALAGMKAGFGVFSYLGALVVGLVSLWLVKKPSMAVAKQVEKNFLTALGWGLLVLVLSGPALLLMTFTGIGLPLAMILGVLLLIDMYMAKIWVSMTMGTLLQKQFGWKKMNEKVVFVLGLTLFYVVSMIPMVGGLVKLVALLSGLGGAWMYLKSVKK